MCVYVSDRPIHLINAKRCFSSDRRTSLACACLKSKLLLYLWQTAVVCWRRTLHQSPLLKNSVFRQQIHNSVLIVAATSDPPFINISQLATTAVVTWWSGFDRVPPRRPRWFLTIMCMLAHLCSAHLLMPARLSTLVFFCGHHHTHGVSG